MNPSMSELYRFYLYFFNRLNVLHIVVVNCVDDGGNFSTNRHFTSDHRSEYDTQEVPEEALSQAHLVC